MFKTRLLSGIVLVIILIATVGTGGGLLFGFLALISLIGLSELYKVVDVQNKILGLTGYLGAVVYYGIFIYRTDAVCDTSYDCISGSTDGGVCVFIPDI